MDMAETIVNTGDCEQAWRGSWHELALDWLYPVECAGCGAPISFSRQRFLCGSCRAKLKLLDEDNSCHHCAASLGKHVVKGLDCPECRGRNHRFTLALAAAKYEEPLRGLVHELKFNNLRQAARPLAALLAEQLANADWIEDIEGVVPVPLHPRRLRERGYNQSALLAGVLAARLKIPLRNNALHKIRDTHPQSLLGREERLTNTREAFAPASDNLGMKKCLLVDDVMTTGSTVSECAVALRAAGVERIYVAVVGR
ncbi:MAG: ComF family protein [Planctomycetes bacterium]|nr:ComF family protein [Planctomycetota bacterium]